MFSRSSACSLETQPSGLGPTKSDKGHALQQAMWLALIVGTMEFSVMAKHHTWHCTSVQQSLVFTLRLLRLPKQTSRTCSVEHPCS
eukprot:3328315-Amphidinium_carterae.1